MISNPAIKTIVVLLSYWISKSKVAGVLQGVSEDDLSRLLREYEITVPSVVSFGGDFISHDLYNAHSHTRQHYIKRHRRSIDAPDAVVMSLSDGERVPKFNKTFLDMRNDMYYDGIANLTSEISNVSANLSYNFSRQHYARAPIHQQRRYLHFNVSAFGSRFQLRVEKKSRLIAPGAKSVLFMTGGHRIEKDLSMGCYYFGKIANQPQSQVAISNCNGLAGLIKTDSDELFIEPLDKADGVAAQRHVVYRRVRSVNGVEQATQHIHLDTEPVVSDELLADSLENILNSREGSFERTKRHSKRSDFNVEVLLAADSKVVQFHGKEHVENYLLTLINIVDEIYHDTSLGEHINIVLTSLYQLDEETSSSLIQQDNPSASLQNVCQWAHNSYDSDSATSGRRPDHAIFLTRRKFGPAGYAHVAGMCQILRSCSLNFEDGFSSAFVVAHETGHVLGMEHDGEGNKCGDETSMGSIMAPLVQAAFHRYHWSRCSQQELQANLRNFACLHDDPHERDWGPTPIYPGVTYSMDDQCRFDFGEGYKRCTAFRNLDVCRALWCAHDDNPLFCKTKKGPPVDGTKCGENQWCFKSRCMWQDQRYRPVHGNWGAWSSYSECSRSCGAGVMNRSRFCNNPEPLHGGNECPGRNIEYDLCNKRACPNNRDFRADQCMYRNNEVEYKNQRHKWLPYEPLSVDLKCELYCMSKKTSDVVTMADYVVDGTQCSYDDPHGICIGGECVEIGCDKVLGSSLREDDCGVCAGNGSECRHVNERINKRSGRKINGYMKLHKIPKGARHLRIEEISSGAVGNLLALKSRVEKRYVLNAKAKQIAENETPYQYVNSRSLWTYESTGGVETIVTRGPINSDIFVMALIKQRNARFSVRCRYVMHSNDVTVTRDTYRYEIKRWTPCSVTCGTGIRKARYGCRSQTRRKWVSKRNCRGRPPRLNRRGPNVQTCTVECRMRARWVTGEWNACSKSCGNDGIQNRNVTCRQAASNGRTRIVSERFCMAEQKPPYRKICNPPSCPAQWRTGSWSRCSVTCGEGVQRRQVLCRTPGKSTSNPTECREDTPSSQKSCQIAPCDDSISPTSSTTVPLNRTSSTATTKKPGKRCLKDQLLYCSVPAMTQQYCSIPRFKEELCCKSCQRYLSSQRRDATGQSAYERPETIAMFSANETNITDLHLNSFENQVISEENFDSTINSSQHNNLTIRMFESTRGMNAVKSRPINTLANQEESQSHFGGIESSAANRNKRNILSNGMEPENLDMNSRRKRSTKRYRVIIHTKEKCQGVTGCGTGVRNSIIRCWDNINKIRVSAKKCNKNKTSFITVCHVPCSVFATSDPTSTLNSRIRWANLICRNSKAVGLGPRVHKSFCNGSVHRKIFSRTFKNLSKLYDPNTDQLSSAEVKPKNTKRVT